MRYQVKPFSQVGHNTFYAVWDWGVRGYVIESNGMVAINQDRKTVRLWATYLNNNLSYQGG